VTSALDSIVNHPRYAPRHGWHDDHRAADGTPAYLPAMQQVRDEFLEFANLLEFCGARSGQLRSCLQLGLGSCDASHAVWRALFAHVVTIDWRECLADDERHSGADTRSAAAITLASRHAPYDLVFIDAGHSFADVQHDYLHYREMLRPGGVIALHDALPRAAYPEVEVHRFIATLSGVKII
jgi:spermidine synthase